MIDIMTAPCTAICLCTECKYLYRGEFGDLVCTNHCGLARVTEQSFCSYGQYRGLTDNKDVYKTLVT